MLLAGGRSTIYIAGTMIIIARSGSVPGGLMGLRFGIVNDCLHFCGPHDSAEMAAKCREGGT